MGSRHKASSIVTDSGTLDAFELVHAHDQLPALTNDEVLALQLRQVLGDSGPRSPDEIGNILVAERSSQKRAARDSLIPKSEASSSSVTAMRA